MTKYKEYLRAKGALGCDPYNEYDFEINTCAGIETTTTTRIMDGCVVVVIYSNIAYPEYAVYDRYGEHGWFDTNGDMSCIERFACDPEYIDWLYGTGYTKSDDEIDIMRHMYRDSEKVRIAFKHMRAGIMSEEVLYKWIVKRFRRIIDNYGYYEATKHLY